MPSGPTKAPRPVMVWLHGGDLSGGVFSGGTGAEYDPRRMATLGDVVVVTVEFRLGVLGFLSLPGADDTGTYGLQDQQAALRWVRSNAAAFGGDPRNVTLFGQSGGAVAVCGQLASPSARGLFDKAIMQSGSCDTTMFANSAGPGTPATGRFWRTPQDAKRAALDAARRLGCSGPGAPACMRRQPVERLLTESGAATGAATGGPTLPVDPVIAMRGGFTAEVPVLSGSTRDEQRMISGRYALLGTPITAQRLPELLTEGFGDRAEAVRARYPATDDASAGQAWAAANTAASFACPQVAMNDTLAGLGAVYGYEFADDTAVPVVPAPPGFASGASHGSELSYLFDITNRPIGIDGQIHPLTSAQQGVAERMIDSWTTFARTGDPGWPVWDPGNHLAHVFTQDPDTPAADMAVEHGCDLWNRTP